MDVERIEPGGLVRILARGSLATVTAFRHRPGEPHRDPAEEWFEHPVVIFTNSGWWNLRGPSGTAEAGADTVVAATAGPYRVRHGELRPTDTTVCVEYQSSHADPAWDMAFQRPGASRTAEIARIHRALERESANSAPGSALKVDGLAMELVAELARAHHGEAGCAAEPRPAAMRADVRERVHAARTYLLDHLDEDVGLGTLGRVVAVSPFHLARLFRTEFGMPPHAYLSRARLERGAELLASTPLPVTRVAERVGWRSPSHFAARFHSHFGLTPTAYRRLTGR